MITIVVSGVLNAIPKPTAVKMVWASVQPSFRMPSGLRVSAGKATNQTAPFGQSADHTVTHPIGSVINKMYAKPMAMRLRYEIFRQARNNVVDHR